MYAVFVALGFALWENISYVLMYGLGTAAVRAVTAVPGHACFGVFMGAFYGLAKRYDNFGDEYRSRRCRRLAVLVPVLLHGAYDFIATYEYDGYAWIFVAFVVLLFAAAYRMIKNAPDHPAAAFLFESYNSISYSSSPALWNPARSNIRCDCALNE